MLKISNSIKTLDESDIGDNLLHYDYNVKHLLTLIRRGICQEDPLYLSSYRSFEGEVFENFVYEKLLIYAAQNDDIEKFVLKGFHQDRIKAHANTLSISEKQQIVYRTKNSFEEEIDNIDSVIKSEDELLRDSISQENYEVEESEDEEIDEENFYTTYEKTEK